MNFSLVINQPALQYGELDKSMANPLWPILAQRITTGWGLGLNCSQMVHTAQVSRAIGQGRFKHSSLYVYAHTEADGDMKYGL